MNETPVLSVIVPVYNGAKFLPQAMENIRRGCPAATEIILVDDGSSDETAQVASLYSDIVFVSQVNAGPAAARNRGLALANGEIIAFLDVDDVWPQGSLQARLEILQQDAQTEIVLGRVRCFRVLDNGETELSDPFTAFNIGAALYRKSVFEKVGFFDGKLRFGEDTDWFLRAREQQAAMQVLDEVTLHYRLHSGGMTHGKGASQLNVVRALKMSLDRRRSENQESSALQNLPPLSSQTLPEKSS